MVSDSGNNTIHAAAWSAVLMREPSLNFAGNIVLSIISLPKL